MRSRNGVTLHAYNYSRPAFDLDSERALLIALLHEPGLIDRETWLSVETFADPLHKVMWVAMAYCREHLLPLDHAHVYGELSRMRRTSEIGSLESFELMTAQSLHLPSRTADHLRVLNEKQLQRALCDECQQVLDDFGHRPTAEVMARHRSNLDKLAGELNRDATSGAVLLSMADVQPKQVQWLWPERFPLGKVSLLIGDPGGGKSLLAADIAARVTRGDFWPCSTERAPQGKVLLVTCEDDAADTLRPRLDLAGADVARVTQLAAVNGPNGERPVNLQNDVPLIDSILSQGGYRLVVFDVLPGFLGAKIDNNSATDVRGVLQPLAMLAAKHNVAILGICHLNKSATTAAKYRTSGSISWNGLARSVMALGCDPDDAELRLLAPIKSNLGRLPSTLAFRVGESNGLPHVEWLAEPVAVSAEQMLGTQTPETPRDRAGEWLQEYLADGPKPAQQVQDAGLAAGHKLATLRRAAKDYGIEITKVGTVGGETNWQWSLP